MESARSTVAMRFVTVLHKGRVEDEKYIPDVVLEEAVPVLSCTKSLSIST